ncbi:hypothetical protein MMC12_005240 [Toensbergia leucococca]|nr:hypothetical protein [Toensbergia leucococca]
MAFNDINSKLKSLILNASVPKTRRPKFELNLKITDLNNVPLVSGTSYVKWHLPSSTSAEHRGRTSKSVIKEHKVAWEYEKTLPVRLTVDRNGILQESDVHFEVLQEYSSTARGERIVLGNVKLNLAEYVDCAEEGEEGVTRRYLMQESKINSTLKIGIWMKQTEGDRNYTAPPLKTAPVFGGIAGIMTAEQGEPDDLGHMPSMSTKTREIGEQQDMYRRTLAASWAAQAGELPADLCIEDIFAGGDGWGPIKSGGSPSDMKSMDGSMSDLGGAGGDKRNVQGHTRKTSAFGRHSENKTKSHVRVNSKGSHVPSVPGGVSGRRSIEQQIQSSSEETEGQGYRLLNEVDELSAREDLRSWEISANG